jgi:predicted nucleotidyltransferase
MIPVKHQAFIDNAVAVLKQDARIRAVALCGSYVTGNMDDYSDLDFMLAVDPERFTQVLNERPAIAGKLGDLLSAFPGDHIGVPDLLICLFGSPLIHADFNFIPYDKAGDRFNGTAILFDKDGSLFENYRDLSPFHATLDPQWLEDRFWVWVHYAALKIARGELFEALDMITYLRAAVLGPLLHAQKGNEPRGVRRLEQVAHEYITELEKTVPSYDACSCVNALRAEIELYQKLRVPYETALHRHAEAEKRVPECLDHILL